jgi:hypothetical protein
MTIKMEPEKDLSQFHHCENCEAGAARVGPALHETLRLLQETYQLSPREAVMALTSAICELSAAQDDPDAAIDEAASAMKKLFASGKEDDPRRNRPTKNPNVH